MMPSERNKIEHAQIATMQQQSLTHRRCYSWSWRNFLALFALNILLASNVSVGNAAVAEAVVDNEKEDDSAGSTFGSFQSWIYDKIEENVEYVQDAIDSKKDELLTTETIQERTTQMLEDAGMSDENLGVLDDLAAAAGAETVGDILSNVQDSIEDTIETAQETLEYHKTQAMQDLNETVSNMKSQAENITNKIQADVEGMKNHALNEVEKFKDETTKKIRQTAQKYKRRFAKEFLNQRVGYERLRHSIRNHLGLVIGVTVAFRGNTIPSLSQGIPLEIGEVSWDFMKDFELLPHDPWLTDLASVIVGGLSTIVLMKTQVEQQEEQQPQPHQRLHDLPAKVVPSLFLLNWLFQFTSIVTDEWDDVEILGQNRFVWIVFGTALSYTWIHVIAKVPTAIAASSIAGSLLIVDSFRAEIVGNWLYMMETISQITYHISPILRRSTKFVVKRAIATWRLRKHVIKATPAKVKEMLSNVVKGIQYGLAVISYPLNTLRKMIFEHPIVQNILKFCNRLRKALGPIYWPIGISIWSATIQMGQIHGIGSLWRTFRFTIDPVSFLINQFSRLFNTKAQLRKAFINFIRGMFSNATDKNNQNPVTNAKGAGKISERSGNKSWFRRNGK